jgi:hypothetical protein
MSGHRRGRLGRIDVAARPKSSCAVLTNGDRHAELYSCTVNFTDDHVTESVWRRVATWWSI